ncbi:MAG: aminotransferase class I/II-fold pyridoxal phosphate-dependent enzyme [Lachnospiraceae bacterium]|nr:aminotransferase class I/II-fold pyridoxal phosphate-dependent enzyme [Lachnospiraceae bacterium]
MEREMPSLAEKLKEYAESDVYPYHMPGHKGNADTGSIFDELHGMDITEIEGFDDLHHATDILKRVQEEAACAFGADRTFYLVGGSTAGILTAVSAVLEPGSELLIARNCHKSVYHAAYLRGLKLHYIVPEYDPQGQILKPVTAAQVRKALREYPNISAVLITSPTYEGLVANVGEIAEAVHEKGIPLIVDEAHGAHFGFASCLPSNSNAWADLVVQSLHKTTKALTQTALLHVNGNRVSAAQVQKYLDIYMTSSPSYLLMASMEEAVKDLLDNGEQLYRDFMQKKESFLKKTAGMKTLFVYQQMDASENEKKCGNMALCMDADENGKTDKKADPCKILICSRAREFSGKRLYDVLLQKYHLQMELCENNHVLAIMTPYDRQEGFDRLAAALNEIDWELTGRYRNESCSIGLTGELHTFPPHLPRQAQTLTESWSEGQIIPITECAGRISAAFVYQYPPGIPLVVPGEVWDEELVSEVVEKIATGYEMLGIVEKCGTIKVVVTENQTVKVKPVTMK